MTNEQISVIVSHSVIPWLGPEFSCRKRLKSTPGHNPVYNPEIRVLLTRTLAHRQKWTIPIMIATLCTKLKREKKL